MAVTQEMAVLVGQRGTPSSARVQAIYGYAVAQVGYVGIHAGDPPRKRPVEYPHTYVGLKDRTHVVHWTVSKSKPRAFPLCDRLGKLLKVSTFGKRDFGG